MRASSIILATLALLALSSCSARVRHGYGGGGVPMEVQIVHSVAEAAAAVEAGAIVCDLRVYDEWAQGHLPRARLVAIPDLEQGRGLPEDLETVILYYGDGPLDTRPEQAAEIAAELGYTRIMLFPGGWRAWNGVHPVAD